MATTKSLQNQPLGGLILSLSVASAPLAFQLPWWVVGWCLLFWSGLLIGRARGWAAPSKVFRLVAFGVGMTAVLISAGLRFDGEDFMVMLAVLAGIKPMEVHRQRDAMATVMVAYFLVITSLFVFENLAMILYLFLSVWVTTGVLIHVNHPREGLGPQMRLAGRLIGGAIPLMILLFLLFPRFSGSLWGTPWGRTSYSGFADTLRLGDVSRLILVDEPAFSVAFDENVPSADQLYWRGIVFQNFNGFTWQPVPVEARRGRRVGGKETVAYTVILEPHGQPYLFALDLPVEVEAVAGAAFMTDHTIRAPWPIRQRFPYRARSSLADRRDAQRAPPAVYLQLPRNRNPGAVELAARWRRDHSQPGSIVAAALAYFQDNGFQYTLRPDPLGINAVDDFLFVSRKGFCEHFASAFAVLMRAAGIPARLVGGYQGGQWNHVGGFLTVRHSDAHVWCEVWLSGRGWLRVDPTAAVSPDRIDLGIETALAQEGLPGFLQRNPHNTLARWGRSVQQIWETLNMRWNVWFMGFSAQEQLELIRRLGLSVNRPGLWLLFVLLPAGGIGLILLISYCGHRRREYALHDEALKLYTRFLNKMTRLGLPKMPHQGPLDYARTIRTEYPALREAADEITTAYIGLRYGCAGDPADLKELGRKVRRFAPRRMMAASPETVSLLCLTIFE